MRTASATRWLDRRLKTAAGSPTVTYRRGNESIVDLPATMAGTQHGDLGDGDVQVTARDQDWLVLQSDLLIGGVFITPATGDEIDWTDSQSVAHTFRVSLRGGDRCFRHTDQTRQLLRVYTVERQRNPE